jgi:hypothetical protein
MELIDGKMFISINEIVVVFTVVLTSICNRETDSNGHLVIVNAFSNVDTDVKSCLL